MSPVGSTVSSAWDAVLRGESGIGPVTRFDVSAFPTRFGGQVRDFDVSHYLPPKEARRMDEFMHYGVAAGVQAVTDSGIDFSKTDPTQCGVVCGAGIGGLWTIEQDYEAYLKAMNPRKMSPFFVPAIIINMISGHLSIRYGLQGPNLGVVTACTTSTHAIGLAMRTIQYGDATVVIAGGGEMATTRCGLGSFGQAKALSTRNDAPQAASRPWDKDRDGFVLSDGGGAVLLEELEHAKKRGARIYAEIVGFGMSGDAHHITSPPGRRGGGAAGDAECPQGCVPEPDRRAVHQRARHLDPARRQGRDGRHEARLRRARQEARGELHQVDDRPPARGRGGR